MIGSIFEVNLVFSIAIPGCCSLGDVAIHFSFILFCFSLLPLITYPAHIAIHFMYIVHMYVIYRRFSAIVPLSILLLYFTPVLWTSSMLCCCVFWMIVMDSSPISPFAPTNKHILHIHVHPSCLQWRSYS